MENFWINTIVESGKQNAFLVPQQAVTFDAKSNYIVTTIQKDNTIQTKKITVIRAIDNKWLVTDGISQTDKIIIEGLGKINEKSIVIPKDVNNLYINSLKEEIK